MSYKPNRLRLKREAISKKRSKQGKYGNEVKRRMMQERGYNLDVVGRMETSAIFGEHVIELLACDDEHCLLMVDGEIRRPRTCAGVKRVIGEWIWKKSR